MFFKEFRLVFIFFLFIAGCRKPAQDIPTPDVKIYNPVVLNYDTVLVGGMTDGVSISSYGICYGTHPLPTIKENVVYGVKTDGFNEYGVVFNCDLTHLDPDIKYYIRTFACQGSRITYSYEYNFINTPSMIFVEGSKSVKYPLQTSSNIELTSFYISKYEITNESYCQFINGNKHLW